VIGKGGSGDYAASRIFGLYFVVGAVLSIELVGIEDFAIIIGSNRDSSACSGIVGARNREGIRIAWLKAGTSNYCCVGWSIV